MSEYGMITNNGIVPIPVDLIDTTTGKAHIGTLVSISRTKMVVRFIPEEPPISFTKVNDEWKCEEGKTWRMP